MATTTAPQAADHTTRAAVPPGTRTQVLGLSLLAAAPLSMFVLGLLTSVPPGDLLPFAIIGAILGASAYVAWRFGTWSKILGIVLTLLGALGGFWIAFGLAAPTSPGDFGPAIALVVGVVLSLYGGGRAIANRRRPTVGGGDGESRMRKVVLTAVVAAVIASVAANVVARTTVDEAAAAGATEVTMASFAFEPEPITVASGAGAALLVRNGDAFLHDLAIPVQDLEVTLTPGSEALLDVSSLGSGTYTYYCTLHSDTSIDDPEEAGMAGTLIVE